MALYLRENTYWADFTVAGKRYRVSTGHTVQKKAEAWMRNKIAEMHGDNNAERVYQQIKTRLVNSQINFSEAWLYFINFPRKRHPCEQLKAAYKSVWEDFAAYCTANNKNTLADVDEKDAIGYITHLQDKGRVSPIVYERAGKTITNKKTTLKLSNRAINTYIGTLKLIFKVFKTGKHCMENPFDAIERMAREQNDREAFTPDELRIIGEKSKGTWLYPLFLTGICTGLRKGDICLLKWDQINDGWLEIKRTRKTGAEVQIPILPPLAAYLKTLSRDGKYVFAELATTYLKDSAVITKAVKKFLAVCGIESQRNVDGRSRIASIKDIHSLRHTFAYIAAVNNIPLPIVQGILGHMSPNMTKHYINHARKEEKLKFLAQLPDYLSAATPDNEKAAPDLMTIRARLESMTAENWQTVRAELLAAL